MSPLQLPAHVEDTSKFGSAEDESVTSKHCCYIGHVIYNEESSFLTELITPKNFIYYYIYSQV